MLLLLFSLVSVLSYILLFLICCLLFFFFFFFNDTATTEIYTLSLHDALPIYQRRQFFRSQRLAGHGCSVLIWYRCWTLQDRKSTRLNSSHEWISYAVFCLKKKKKINN